MTCLSFLRQRWRRILTLGALAGVLVFLVCWFVLPWAFPLPALLREDAPEGVVFLDRNGESLRLVPVDGHRSLEPVTYEELPGALKKAIVAVEDQRFWEHSGLDFLGIGRATIDNWQAGRVVSGASTISQQLIKIGHPTPRPPRTIGTKIREGLITRRLEMSWSKEEILTAYFNRVEFGNQFTGVRVAARGYFGKSLADLSPGECALLAGLPQSPSRLDPVRNPWNARERRDHVLARMTDEGLLDEVGHRLAKAETVQLPFTRGGFQAAHAVDQLLRDQTGPGPGTIMTTLDLDLQRLAEEVVARHLDPLRSRNGSQGAVVILDNRTGHVLALVGSGDYDDPKGGQINGAWVPHPAGSTLKPFTYLLALEKGWRASDLLGDLPQSFSTASGLYQPVNYDRRFHGPVTLRDALAGSLNVSAVTLLNEIGGAEALHAAMQDLGFTSLDEQPAHYGLGLTLGNAGVRLLELANAYATIARGGRWEPWRLSMAAEVTTETGESRQVFDPRACWLVSDILSDNRARTTSFGTHSPLRLSDPVAVKTGTSSDFRDNWTVGFDPRYTIAVWVGNFDNEPMRDVSGVSGAAPIFRSLFEELRRRESPTWFTRPPGIATGWIDSRTGKILTAQLRDELPVDLTREESFLVENPPPAAQADDYDRDGRALLDQRYQSWLGSADNAHGQSLAIRTTSEPTTSSSSATRSPGRGGHDVFESPSPGSHYYLDPDLPDSGRNLPLRMLPPSQSSRWESSTLVVKDGFVILEPGSHLLRARDQAGQWHEIEFTVEEL